MPKIDREAIYDRDGGLCGFCGEPVDALRWDMDHRQPRRLGGPTEPLNLRPAHPRCNRQAGAKLGALLHEPLDLGVHINLRVPDELAKTMQGAAREDARSLNAEIMVALREWLARRRRKP